MSLASQLGAAGNLQLLDKLMVLRGNELVGVLGTVEDFVKMIIQSSAGANRRYPDLATACADGTLANGTYFDVVPSTHGGATDIYRRDTALAVAAQPFIIATTAQSVLDAAVVAAQLLLANMDNRMERSIPTLAKPVLYMRLAPRLRCIRIKGLAGSGFVARRDDFFEILMWNADANMARCWCIAATRARIDGEWHDLSNSVSEQTVNGTNDSGLQYTTHEFALSPFEDGETPSAALAPYCGPFHGGLTTITAGTDFRMDGGVDLHVDANDPVGTIKYGTQLVMTQAFNLMTKTNAKVAARSTMTHTFNATEHCIIECYHDFAHAAVNCTPRLWNSYESMIAGRTADRIKPIGAPAIVLNNAIGTQTNLGKKTVHALYHSNKPNVLLEHYMRYGAPMRIDGVNDNWSQQFNAGAETFVVEQGDYVKKYNHAFSFVGTNSWLAAGHNVRTSNRITARLATPA